MLRPWSFNLTLNKDANQAIYLQVAEKITEEIRTGRLLPGFAMPGTRDLAKTLDVNRKTIVQAYDELIAQGWLVTEKRRGTFVAEDCYALPDFAARVGDEEHSNSQLLAQANVNGSATLSKALPVIDFTDGMSDNRLAPLETFSRAFRRALLMTTRSRQLMHHPQGALELRSAIANMVNLEKNFRVDAEQVCVLSSSQMAVFVIARLLTTQNDCVVFERLSHPLSRQAFEACGANIEYVDVDADGADVEQIARLATLRKIRAVYVTPQHQFPTSVMMADERRKALIRLAEQHDFYIIEDDREHEFYFDHSLPFPLASSESSKRVIYLGSLSNVLSPAMEMSYLIADKPFIERCVAEKSLIECQNKISLEYAVYELMESGEIQRHRRRIGKIFAERRTMMDEIIQQELGEHVEYNLPKSGLAFWLNLRSPVDMARFVAQSEKERVRFAEGSQFAAHGEEVKAVRLGFASLNTKELRSGIQRIKQALAASVMSLMVLVSEPMLH